MSANRVPRRRWVLGQVCGRQLMVTSRADPVRQRPGSRPPRPVAAVFVAREHRRRPPLETKGFTPTPNRFAVPLFLDPKTPRFALTDRERPLKDGVRGRMENHDLGGLPLAGKDSLPEVAGPDEIHGHGGGHQEDEIELRTISPRLGGPGDCLEDEPTAERMRNDRHAQSAR